jgi:hypothetical protein
MGEDLGIGFGTECEAFPGQEGLEVEVVFDDAVVDEDHAVGTMGMGVGFGGAAVGGPAGVADAAAAGDRSFLQDLFQIPQLPLGAADLDPAVAQGGDPSRIIAAVFQAPKPFDDDAVRRLGSGVADDSAHGRKSFPERKKH